jgi:hypothetical protein
MDKSKTTNLAEKLVFIYLLLFPFGQLLAIRLSIFNANIRLHPIDLVALASVFCLSLRNPPLPKVSKFLYGLLASALFSLALSLIFFDPAALAIGLLYFLRVFAYVAFFVAIYNLVKARPQYKKTLFYGLIIVSLEVGLLGLVQYLFLPDLRFLYALAWDDHLFRLAGTFLDPGFTGIILAFGAILSLGLYLKEKKKLPLFSFMFLTVCLLLTYSRASFVAFLLGIGILFLKTRQKLVLSIAGLFILSMLFLPRPEGYGVRLERTHSIVSRLQNYSETASIFQKSPIFGIGFNNMCIARQVFLGGESLDSHACSGADSSILLILSTLGVLGLILTVFVAKEILSGLTPNYFSYGFLACSLALVLHSQFVNSLFYPWVMGYVGILGGLTLAPTKGKSLP